MMTSTAQQLADELNSYNGDNFWQDVVEGYDLDRDAIDEADPSGMSTVVILADGSTVRFREDRREWIVEGHRVIYPASSPGTHPSHASPGLYAFRCAECGDSVQYTGRIDEAYKFHNETVGVRDPGSANDWCGDCAAQIYEKNKQ